MTSKRSGCSTMADRPDMRTFRALLSVLIGSVAIASVAHACDSTEAAGEDSLRVSLVIVSLGGRSERYGIMTSGRVEHQDDWEAHEFRLSAQDVEELEHRLRQCGLCDLGGSEPVPTRGSKLRILVELSSPAERCSTDMPWEVWQENSAATQCLDAVRSVLETIVSDCGSCTVP